MTDCGCLNIFQGVCILEFGIVFHSIFVGITLATATGHSQFVMCDLLFFPICIVLGPKLTLVYSL
jgi:hypothetical protein